MSPKPNIATTVIARLLSGEDTRLRDSFSTVEVEQLVKRFFVAVPPAQADEHGVIVPRAAHAPDPSWVEGIARRLEQLGVQASGGIASTRSSINAFQKALEQAFFTVPAPLHLGPEDRSVSARVIGKETSVKLIAEGVTISPVNRKESLLTGKLMVSTRAVAQRFAEGGAGLVFLSLGDRPAHLLDLVDLRRTAEAGDTLIELSILLPDTQLAAQISNAHRGLSLELYAG